MDNAQKAIMIGVALFLTILVIAVVLLITNTGLNTAKKSGDQIATISTNLEKQLVSQYDQKILTAQDIKNAINMYNKQLNGNIMVAEGSLTTTLTTLTPWRVAGTASINMKHIAANTLNIDTCKFFMADPSTAILGRMVFGFN